MSFERTRDAREQICRVLDREDVPMILVGNKADLEQLRTVGKGEGEERAREWQCPYIETSAKLRQNVNEAYEAIVRLIVEDKRKHFANESSKKSSCVLL